MLESAICILIGLVFGSGCVAILVIPSRLKMERAQAGYDAAWKNIRTQLDEESAVARRRHEETHQEIGALWKQCRETELRMENRESNEISQLRELIQAGGMRQRSSNHPPVGSDT